MLPVQDEKLSKSLLANLVLACTLLPVKMLQSISHLSKSAIKGCLQAKFSEHINLVSSFSGGSFTYASTCIFV